MWFHVAIGMNENSQVSNQGDRIDDHSNENSQVSNQGDKIDDHGNENSQVLNLGNKIDDLDIGPKRECEKASDGIAMFQWEH